jgi:hypothetical protein
MKRKMILGLQIPEMVCNKVCDIRKTRKKFVGQFVPQGIIYSSSRKKEKGNIIIV